MCQVGFSRKTLVFIGLNPSKASDSNQDPTLRRLVGFSRNWGYGKIYVVNLFARISAFPALLKKVEDPIGQENDGHILSHLIIWSGNPECDLWLGWGCRGNLLNRDLAVIAYIEKYGNIRNQNFPESFGPLCLGLTKGAQPRHPLYVCKRELLKPFQPLVQYLLID